MSAVGKFLALVCRQRDQIMEAAQNDVADDAFIAKWKAVAKIGGQLPSGRAERLFNKWLRDGRILQAFRQADAELAEYGLERFLGRLEKLEEIHRKAMFMAKERVFHVFMREITGQETAEHVDFPYIEHGDACAAVMDIVLPALEAKRRDKALLGADKPDNDSDKTRISKKPQQEVPSNPEVTKLIGLLNKPSNQDRSQSEVAIEFTEGNRKKAESLLRGVRRYRHLLTLH